MPSKQDLDEAAKRYSRHSIPGKVIAYASEAVISGREADLDMYSREDLKIAQDLVNAVRASEEKEAGGPYGPTTPEGNDTFSPGLFRGLSSDHPAVNALADVKDGDTLSFGRITSFTALDYMAHNYAARDTQSRPAVLVVLRGKAKTFFMDEHSKMPGHAEYITHGKFKVVKVEHHDPSEGVGIPKRSRMAGRDDQGFYKVVTIEQESVF